MVVPKGKLKRAYNTNNQTGDSAFPFLCLSGLPRRTPTAAPISIFHVALCISLPPRAGGKSTSSDVGREERWATNSAAAAQGRPCCLLMFVAQGKSKAKEATHCVPVGLQVLTSGILSPGALLATW